ncbi:DNA-3-methyladenine glycosylase I [Aliiroseovarius subalbicans]|uniref:DNA-3-methyladenine glycosylase I n=1 Tax=Aliiroseovarius subalbicans TaxID=2925840 RepID=UPI001F5A195F|nr:DNA-3-methyladenine glycosylase I [Aliiroseovarius subalbicans]MCI2399548.1 DNA-3-methyladenine glycosylase I [Aliiroseovarius subalbicans]
MERCGWCGDEPIYVEYHDTEWGVPEYDGRALWEKLILDGFQAGLSWITILKKRDNFRAAFRGFDPAEIACWGEEDVLRLVNDKGIIRHRGKIEATIGNARTYLDMGGTDAFSEMMWGYVGGTPLVNQFETLADVPPATPLSTQVSKDLKRLGFRFCGPTITYAWMQACGLVNDHLVTCPCHTKVQGKC